MPLGMAQPNTEALPLDGAIFWKHFSGVAFERAMTALTQSIIDEVKSATEPVQWEVWDFLLFLKSRRDGAKDDLPPLAQSAWAKDWDKPEEDAAWRDL
jgi:hypothetical protein